MKLNDVWSHTHTYTHKGWQTAPLVQRLSQITQLHNNQPQMKAAQLLQLLIWLHSAVCPTTNIYIAYGRVSDLCMQVIVQGYLHYQ